MSVMLEKLSCQDCGRAGRRYVQTGGRGAMWLAQRALWWPTVTTNGPDITLFQLCRTHSMMRLGVAALP